MKNQFSKVVILALAFAIAGCSQKPRNENQSQSSSALKPEAAHTEEAAPASASNAGLKFTPPQEWIAETPSSSNSNRQAQYKLPRVAGDKEDAELIIYYFGGGGGTPQANVERWVGQFTGPDGKPANNAQISNKTVNGIPLTIVDVSGTYSSSMGMMQQGGPKPGMRMLGAIAEAGNGPWFIKLTGPEKTVSRWKPSFESFLNSIAPANL